MPPNQATTLWRWAIVILVLSASASSRLVPLPPAICPKGYSVVDGTCLQLMATPEVHKIAHEELCASLHVHVALIDTQVKNDWVQKELEYIEVERATFDLEIRNGKWYHANSEETGFLIHDWTNMAKRVPYLYHQHFAIRATDGKWEMATRGNPANAVVCEKPLFYPRSFCPSGYNFTQGNCFHAPSLSHRTCERSRRKTGCTWYTYYNYRDYNGALKACSGDQIPAALDTPEKNKLVTSMLNEPHRKWSGYFGYLRSPAGSSTWKFLPSWANNAYSNYPPGRRPLVYGQCYVLQYRTGTWIAVDCKVEALPVCQWNVMPLCFMPTHIAHADIEVIHAHRTIQVKCLPGMKRIGPSGFLTCLNTRYGNKFPHVQCVPNSKEPYDNYTNPVVCENRYLTFPLGVHPHTPIPTFAYANRTCAKAYLEIPNDNDYACLMQYIKTLKWNNPFPLFVGDKSGPWIYLTNITGLEKYRWVFKDGNTGGFSRPTETNYDNRVICAGELPYPDLGGEDIVFQDVSKCPGMTLRFPQGMAPNTNIPAFKVANDTCNRANMSLPDTSALPCLQRFIEHIRNDVRFVNFSNHRNGPWVYLSVHSETPYRWVDKDGKTRGYEESTATHINNHVVCITKFVMTKQDAAAARMTSLRTASVVTGVVCAVAVIGVLIAVHVFRRARSKRAEATVGVAHGNARGGQVIKGLEQPKRREQPERRGAGQSRNTNLDTQNSRHSHPRVPPWVPPRLPRK